jgi:hypothetical protein
MSYLPNLKCWYNMRLLKLLTLRNKQKVKALLLLNSNRTSVTAKGLRMILTISLFLPNFIRNLSYRDLIFKWSSSTNMGQLKESLYPLKLLVTLTSVERYLLFPYCQRNHRSIKFHSWTNFLKKTWIWIRLKNLFMRSKAGKQIAL